MKIQLKTVFGDLIFEGDFTCIAEAVKAALAEKKSLSSANLSSADLRYADLRYANLRSADLSSANLSSADLSYANLSSAVDSWAQIVFKGHGECGRMLTVIRLKKTDEPHFYCGCFSGKTKALRSYIEEGDQRMKRTRTLAMETALTLLDTVNDE